MFRLAHISDLHLGPLPSPSLRQLANKRIFGYVNWRRNRKGVLTTAILDGMVDDLHAQKPDHIAVTGDLVNLALPNEIDNARDWLDTLGTPHDVSIVQGNHDAYVPYARQMAEKAWAPYLTGDEPVSDDHAFPYLRVRDKVALIGVNTARATLPLLATGYFRPKQAKQLGQILDHCKEQGLFRVVMIHHPPCRNATHWHKRLVGASRFRATIKQHGAELVLHGHTHLATKNALPGPEASVPVICVPSASQGLGSHKPPARYNLFEISGEPGSWSCNLIERGYAQGEPTQTVPPIVEINRQILPYSDA